MAERNENCNHPLQSSFDPFADPECRSCEGAGAAHAAGRSKGRPGAAWRRLLELLHGTALLHSFAPRQGLAPNGKASVVAE